MRLLIILLSMFLLLSTLAYAEKAYVVKLGNMDNTITFTSVNVLDASIPQRATIKDAYSVEMVNLLGKISYKSSFNVPGYGAFTLTLPYKSDAEEIVIKDPSGAEVLKISVSHFANSCGNDICEPSESYETCSRDCPSGTKDDYCDKRKDDICDPDCAEESDPDCVGKEIEKPKEVIKEKPRLSPPKTIKPAPEKGFSILNIALIIVSILALASTILILTTRAKKMKEKAKREAQIRNYITYYQRQGYQIQQIRQGLLNQNYSQKEIDEVIKSLYGR